MRWIIGITICLALAVVAWFWIPRLMENQNLDPLSLLAKDSWAIVQLDEAHDYQIINDSSSAFRTFDRFALLRELAAQLPDNKKHWFFIYGTASSPNFGLITETELKAESLSYHLTSGKYEVYGSTDFDPYGESSTSIHRFINTAGEGTLKVLIKPQDFLNTYQNRFGKPLLNLLLNRFNHNDWMALDLSEEDHLFKVSGIENSDAKDETNVNQRTSLLRYLPGNSGAAAIQTEDSISTAWAYCPYNQLDTSSDLNYFGFIESIESSPSDINTGQEYQDFPVSIESIDSSTFGINLAWHAEAYKAQLSDHVSVYAGSFSQLALLIDDFLADDKLISSPYFTFLENQVSDASFTLFLRPDLLREERTLLRQANAPNHFNALIYQSFNELPLQQFHSIAILHHKEIKDEAPLAWMVRLDSTIASGPWSFTNHFNNENEIVVQDNKNQLYLINKDGKTLWKKRLSGKINDELIMVDAFSNGKYQMFFTTSSKLYFLDRNGNNVAGFPVELTNGTAVSPLCVRYKNADEYRIIVNDGNTLKNFDIEGNAVKGWKNPELDAPLKQKADYVYFNGKDYLVSCNTNNLFRIFDRTGDKRLSNQQGDSNVINYDLHIGSRLNNTRYIGFDSVGKIHIRPLTSESESFNILPLGGDIGFETTSSDEYRYISSKDDRVVVLDDNQDVSLDYLMPESLHSRIQVLSESRKWIGLEARENDHFYILDMKGRMLDKMPLVGKGKAVLVDLDDNGSMELVIGDGKTALNAYKLAD